MWGRAILRSRHPVLWLGFMTILAMACSRSDQQFISIGTGGTGGVYYPYGGGLAEIWSQHVPGIRAMAEVTGASVENVKLAHRGETVIGEIMGDVAFQAYHGEGNFQDEPQNILAMAVMYPNVLQVVTTAGSGIQGIEDLSGRTVSVGAPGSGTAFMSGLVLDAMGMEESSVRIRRLSFVETANALKDRTIDAGIWVVAPPTSSLMDLATTHDINLVPITPEQIEAISARYSFYSGHELPTGTYRGMETPVSTLQVWNVIICNADLSEELVYNLTRTLFENRTYLENIHPYARFTTPENTWANSPIPLHPGAIRYLREQGLEVPSELVPEDSAQEEASPDGTPQGKSTVREVAPEGTALDESAPGGG